VAVAEENRAGVLRGMPGRRSGGIDMPETSSGPRAWLRHLRVPDSVSVWEPVRDQTEVLIRVDGTGQSAYGVLSNLGLDGMLCRLAHQLPRGAEVAVEMIGGEECGELEGRCMIATLNRGHYTTRILFQRSN